MDVASLPIVKENKCLTNSHRAAVGIGLDFNPHTHSVPTEKPVGISTESPSPQNPEILHSYTPHHASFS